MNRREPLRKMFRIRDSFPEFMFSLYVSLYSLVKPFTQPTGYAGILLFIITFFCAYLLLNKVNKLKRKGDFSVLIRCSTIIVFCLFVDVLFRYNLNISEYVYNYFLYGFISLFFIAYVRDFRSVLYFFSIIASVNGLIYLFDPVLNDYNLSGGYMQFGFNSLMPAFAGAVLLVYYFKKKWAWFLIITFLIFLFVFANKGAFLCALLILLFAHLYIKNQGKVKFMPLMVAACVICLIMINIKSLIGFGFDIARLLGISDTYALRTFEAMFTGSEDMVFNARYEVWEEAIKMIEQKPLFGWGVGWFEQYSIQPYPHNFVLEFLVDYGWLGTFVFIIIFMNAFVNMIKIKNYEKKIFTIIILILWAFPLSISMTFWKVSFFWMYWFLCFSANKNIISYEK